MSFSLSSGFNTGQGHVGVERQHTLRTKARREKRGRVFTRSLTIAYSRPFRHKPTATESHGYVTVSDDVFGRRRSTTRQPMPHNHDVRSSQNSLYTRSFLESRKVTRIYEGDRVKVVSGTADEVVR